jgi:hypothetical protein
MTHEKELEAQQQLQRSVAAVLEVVFAAEVEKRRKVTPGNECAAQKAATDAVAQACQSVIALRRDTYRRESLASQRALAASA